MKATMTTTTLVPVLALVAFFAHAQRAQGQPLTHTSVVEADILALIVGPPVATAGVAFTFDLQGDPGIIQSAAYPMADGNFLYAYQWECHTGPNWDILTLHIPMAGSTPVAIDINGDGSPDDSWSITDKTGFMPYNQQPTGLQALCGSDSFSVSTGDFATAATFDSVQDEIVFRNFDGIFLSSNIYGFIGCTPPQVVQTTAGGGSNFGTTVIFTTAPFPVVAPSGPCCEPGAEICDVDDDEIEVLLPPGVDPGDVVAGRITMLDGVPVNIPAHWIDDDCDCDDDGDDDNESPCVELEFDDLPFDLDEAIEVCVELDLVDGSITCETCFVIVEDDDDDDD